MRDPWAILNLDATADETAIRRRYLELVKQHPPDRDPERFREVRQAYERVRDPLERLRTLLFGLEGDRPLDSIIAELRSQLQQSRIPTSALLQLAEVP